MEEKIIKLYKEGKGSPTISKMLSISKKKVLDILNKNNLIIKNNYDGYQYRDNKWWYHYDCNQCGEKIECYASEKYLLYRNLKKKDICKKCSLENQFGEGNPFYGKTHSDETKTKISKSRVGKATKEKNAMSKKENRDKLSKKLKEVWANEKSDERRKEMSILMKKRIANGEIKGYNVSKAEYEIINNLKNDGIDCTGSFRINSKVYDIYIPKYNLLIEYNGDYWHCNPKKYGRDYFNHKKSLYAYQIWENDKVKLHLAKENNYNYEVVWENEYKKNPKIIQEIIIKYERKNE